MSGVEQKRLTYDYEQIIEEAHKMLDRMQIPRQLLWHANGTPCTEDDHDCQINGGPGDSAPLSFLARLDLFIAKYHRVCARKDNEEGWSAGYLDRLTHKYVELYTGSQQACLAWSEGCNMYADIPDLYVAWGPTCACGDQRVEHTQSGDAYFFPRVGCLRCNRWDNDPQVRPRTAGVAPK